VPQEELQQTSSHFNWIATTVQQIEKPGANDSAPTKLELVSGVREGSGSSAFSAKVGGNS
jgi:hypothetical protein